MARKAKEEEAAALEFEKWKGEISVDAEGTTESDMQDGSQGLLSSFVEYIKVHYLYAFEDIIVLSPLLHVPILLRYFI